MIDFKQLTLGQKILTVMIMIIFLPLFIIIFSLSALIGPLLNVNKKKVNSYDEDTLRRMWDQ